MAEIYKRKLPSGNTALYLHYMLNGEQRRDLLKDLVLRPGQTSHNREAMAEAEMARSTLERELASGRLGIIPQHRKRSPLLPWMQQYVDKVRPSDFRMHNAVFRGFEDFVGNPDILASAVTPALCEAFRRHLHDKHNGETPFNYWKYFKRILKAAVEAGFFTTNPADGIKNINRRANEIRKKFLSSEEISILAQSHCGNEAVKRAFLFSTQTGLRRCDIERLQWCHIFIGTEDRYIDFGQKKMGDKRTIIPLNDNAIRFLGVPGDQKAFIFRLPTHNGTNKDIKYWVENAGIKKHITFHCARHSCATIMLERKVDLKTVSEVMGHSSTRMTERYLHITQRQKREAVNMLPAIDM